MSAGNDHSLIVCRATDVLAPRFRERLEMAVSVCRQNGIDVIVYETIRSNELQQMYYRRGRPPTKEYPTPVTNADRADKSWHFFGLAADCISESKRWSAPDSWWEDMAQVMEDHGLDCGIRWDFPDKPHVQFGGLKKSPSFLTRDAYRNGGLTAVWQLVDAI